MPKRTTRTNAETLENVRRQAERQANERAYELLAEVVDRRVYQALRNNKPGEAVQLVQVLDHMSDVLGLSIPF